jgi:hypothetical protein
MVSPRQYVAGLRRARLLALTSVAAITVFFAFLAAQCGAQAAPPAQVSTYTFGVENSWIRVQNVGGAPATVTVSFFDEQGRQLGADTCPSAACPALAPGGGWTFFQGQQPQLRPGYRGSAVVESDQPIVALMAKDVWRDGRFSIGADTTTIAAAGSRLFIPLTANADGPNRDWNGRFAIQNLSASTACVTITYLSNVADAEVAWDPYKPGTNAAKQPGCPNGGRPIPLGGTLFRGPGDFGVPQAFTGSVRVDTHKNGSGVEASEQLISATAETYNATTKHFASYRAVPEGDLSTTVLLPLVDREVGPFNGWSTHFQIVNKDPKKPAQVTLRFEGFDVDGGLRFVAKQHTLTVNAARMCFQDRDDFANCLASGDRLPRTFVGTARITSTQPIAVIVNRGAYYDDTFTNYRGLTPADGAHRVLLPLLNKNYGPANGGAGWNSWFRVLVADGGAANVRIRYLGLNLPGGEVSYTVSAFREFTVFQPNEAILPNNFAGTAILESDRPIVALANVYTDVFPGDTNFLYNAVPLP